MSGSCPQALRHWQAHSIPHLQIAHLLPSCHLNKNLCYHLDLNISISIPHLMFFQSSPSFCELSGKNCCRPPSINCTFPPAPQLALTSISLPPPSSLELIVDSILTLGTLFGYKYIHFITYRADLGDDRQAIIFGHVS